MRPDWRTSASVAAAIRYCFEQHHIVIEGAAGTAVAAALEAEEGSGPVVALVSGGNIDVSTFTTNPGGKGPSTPRKSTPFSLDRPPKRPVECGRRTEVKKPTGRAARGIVTRSMAESDPGGPKPT